MTKKELIKIMLSKNDIFSIQVRKGLIQFITYKDFSTENLDSYTISEIKKSIKIYLKNKDFFAENFNLI